MKKTHRVVLLALTAPPVAMNIINTLKEHV